MKNQLILFILLLVIGGCTKQNNKCIKKDFSPKKEDLSFKFDNFKLIFLDVKSIDNVNNDFVMNSDSIGAVITQKFLESDNLHNKKFIIQSKVIDSISIKLISYNDYVFYGEEKLDVPINLGSIDTIDLNCEKNVFTLPLFESKKKQKLIKQKAYEKNLTYYKKVSTSQQYTDREIKFAYNFIENSTINDFNTLDELFVKYDNIKTILMISYFINGKKYKKKIIYFNNDVDYQSSIKNDTKTDESILKYYDFDLNKDDLLDKIAVFKNDKETEDFDKQHFGLSIKISKATENGIIGWKYNNELVFNTQNNCISEGFEGIVLKDNYFTIEQQTCYDYNITVSSYTTFKVLNNEIFLHKYGEEYFDKVNHERKIPTKIWTTKDFGEIKFEDVTESFLINLRK